MPVYEEEWDELIVGQKLLTPFPEWEVVIMLVFKSQNTIIQLMPSAWVLWARSQIFMILPWLWMLNVDLVLSDFAALVISMVCVIWSLFIWVSSIISASSKSNCDLNGCQGLWSTVWCKTQRPSCSFLLTSLQYSSNVIVSLLSLSECGWLTIMISSGNVDALLVGLGIGCLSSPSCWTKAMFRAPWLMSPVAPASLISNLLNTNFFSLENVQSIYLGTYWYCHFQIHQGLGIDWHLDCLPL